MRSMRFNSFPKEKQIKKVTVVQKVNYVQFPVY
jgi:hypothetical protein